MNRVLLICLVIAPFIICSALTRRLKGGPVVFTRFPVERQLEETEFYKVSNLTPDGLQLYDDSLLFIRNKDNNSRHHFALFNLNNKTFGTPHFPLGNGYGQSMGFISYGMSYGNLWAYDIMKDKVILSGLPQGKATTVKEFSMPTFYYSIQLLNDSTIVASGDYDASNKVALVDLRSGKATAQMAPYAPDAMKQPSRGWKSGYESFLFLQPSKQKCVLACRYADQVEIVDLPSRQSTIIKGPENYEPQVSEMTMNDGSEVSARNFSTRFAFVKGKTTDRFIYLLYSGNNHESSHLDYGKCIYVYDWNGRPIQKLNLNNYIQDFAVTKNDSLLYTYNPNSKFIKVANLSTVH